MKSIQLSAEQQTQDLFQRKGLNEIRQIESHYRNDIENKKHQLRTHIGNRYKDIIDAADSVYAMKEVITQLNDTFQTLEGQLLSASKSSQVFIDRLEARAVERQRKNIFHLLGQRIKLLIDTPEEIWYALETNHLLKATTSYLIAKKTYMSITELEEKSRQLERVSHELITTPPIAQKQWNIVSEFLKIIIDSAKSSLRSNDCSFQDYGSALCAILFLENKKPIEVFHEFLASRKAALMAIFSGDAKKFDENEVIQSFNEFLLCLANTLLSILSLFLATTHHSIPESYLKGDWGERGLFYSQANSISKDEGISDMKGIREILEIPEEEVCRITFEWLHTIQKEFSKLSAWFERIKTPTVLSKLEDSLISTIQTPFKNIKGKFSLNELSYYVAGENFDFWNILFMNPILAQNKNIIDSLFETISINFSLKNAIQVFEEKGPFFFEETNVSSFVWGNHQIDNSNVKTRKQRSLAVTNYVASIIEQLDTQVKSIIDRVICLFESKSTRGNELNKRILKELKEHLHLSFFHRIQENLSTLGQNNDSSLMANLSVTDSTYLSLLLGRIATAIVTYSKFVKLLLQNNSEASSNLDEKFSFLEPSSDIHFHSIKTCAEEIVLKSQIKWANHIIKNVKSKIHNFLRDDDWTNLLLKKYWMPIIIEGKNDKLEEKQPTPTPTPIATNPENSNALNGTNTETTIQPTAIVEQELEHIPHQPSQFITTILYEICLEIQRAHGQIIGHAIIQYIIREISKNAVQEFLDFLDQTPKHSEFWKDNLLQFWFDTKYLVFILSDRNVTYESLLNLLNENKSELENNMVLWTKNTETLNKRIKELMDPVDLMFYETRLHHQIKACYFRTRLVFSDLTLQNHLKNDSTKVPIPNSTISMMPAAPRFKLLPITETQTVVSNQELTEDSKKQGHSTEKNPQSKVRSLWDQFSNLGGFLEYSGQQPSVDTNSTQGTYWFG